MPDDSLRNEWKEEFAEMRLLNGQLAEGILKDGSSLSDWIARLLTEQIALARTEEMARITNWLRENGWRKTATSIEIALSPAPVVPEGEKLV